MKLCGSGKKDFDFEDARVFDGANVGITHEDALRRLEGKSLKPLEPFPGGGGKPWKLLCGLCGQETCESLHKVGKRTRPGCASCCSKSQNRISAETALARLAEKMLTPLEEYPGTIDAKWNVQCQLCGQISSTTITRLAGRINQGCSKCGLKTARDENTVPSDKAIQRLARLGLRALDPYPGHTKLPWRCVCNTCGTEIYKPLNHLENGAACSFCKSEESARAFAAAAEAELTKFGFTPLALYPGTEKGWKAKCQKCGKVSSPRINSLRYQKSGCRHCAMENLKIASIEKTRSKALELITGASFAPIGEYPGFAKPWKAKCLQCGKTSSPSAKGIKEGSGCRYCAKNAPWSRRFAASLAKQANRKLLEEFQGSRVPILMECLRCGSRDKATPSSLKSSKGYCRRCKPTAEWTSDKAVQILRAANLEPLEPFKKATAKWRVRCMICGTEGSPQVTNIASGQGGCKVCGNFGFDINKPTTLYVLYNRKLRVVKVGITNTGSTRLRTLASVGLMPGKLYEFPEGSEPLEIETKLLRHIKKDLGLKQALTKVDMRGAGGATETFWLDELPPQRIHAKIKSLRRS